MGRTILRHDVRAFLAYAWLVSTSHTRLKDSSPLTFSLSHVLSERATSMAIAINPSVGSSGPVGCSSPTLFQNARASTAATTRAPCILLFACSFARRFGAGWATGVDHHPAGDFPAGAFRVVDTGDGGRELGNGAHIGVSTSAMGAISPVGGEPFRYGDRDAYIAPIFLARGYCGCPHRTPDWPSVELPG